MDSDQILKELQFKAVRSSGPGGQHVNKTASKIELSFNIQDSEGLRPEEKNRLEKKLAPRISSDGILILQCDETRSQHRNKKLVVERLLELLLENLKVPKARKKTKPSKSVIEKRLKAKQNNALKKASRRPPKID